MTQSWLRLWHDMPTDPKWRVVARISGQPLAAVVALFTMMLVEASLAEDRGSLADWRHEDAAANLDMDEGAVAAIFEAMRGRVHDGERLSRWEKRQPRREDPEAGVRGKVSRDRRRQGEAVSSAPEPDLFTEPVTRMTRTVNRNDSLESESDEDSEINHTTGARGSVRDLTGEDVSALRLQLSLWAGPALATVEQAPKLLDLSPIIGLLGPGAGPPCDLERDIGPAIQAMSARMTPGSCRTWSYFCAGIVERRDANLAGAPAISEKPHGRPAAGRAGPDARRKGMLTVFSDPPDAPPARRAG